MDEEKNPNCKIMPTHKYLSKIVPVAGVILTILFIVLIISQAVGVSNKIKAGRSHIAISGEGKVLAKPDIGQIDLTVLTPKATVALAQAENSKKMNAILEGMKNLGIKEEDLKTTNYQISPTYQYQSGRSLIVGYEVRQTLQVKIRDLDKVSEILDKAAFLGANEVGSLSFTIDDEEKLKEEARQKAVANAEEKARALAKTLGVKLGEITSFSETSNEGPQPLYYSGLEALGKGGGGAAPEIQTGQNEIYVYVTLNYEIY